MTTPEPSLFERTLQLENPDPGIYERDIDQTWYGWNGQFGGYVLALTLEACRREVTAEHRELMLSMSFLRRFAEGRFRIEVTTERQGRTITSLSFRHFVNDELSGVGHAIFGSARNSEEFQLATPPDLTPPPDHEEPQPSPIPAEAVKHLAIWPRHTAGLSSGADIAEVHGWMQLVEHGGADERFLLNVADAYLPISAIRATAPATGGTIDFTAHFREAVPEAIVRGDEPVLVRLRCARLHAGYADEDTELWSADGRLLMQTRQVRYNQLMNADDLAFAKEAFSAARPST